MKKINIYKTGNGGFEDVAYIWKNLPPEKLKDSRPMADPLGSAPPTPSREIKGYIQDQPEHVGTKLEYYNCR